MLLPRLSINPTICGLIRPEVAALGPLPLIRSLWLSLCQLLGEVVGIHYGCLFPIRSKLGPSTSIFNPLIQVLFDLLVHFVEFLLLIIFSLLHHFGFAEALGTLGIVYSESSIRWTSGLVGNVSTTMMMVHSWFIWWFSNRFLWFRPSTMGAPTAHSLVLTTFIDSVLSIRRERKSVHACRSLVGIWISFFY